MCQLQLIQGTGRLGIQREAYDRKVASVSQHTGWDTLQCFWLCNVQKIAALPLCPFDLRLNSMRWIQIQPKRWKNVMQNPSTASQPDANPVQKWAEHLFTHLYNWYLYTHLYKITSCIQIILTINLIWSSSFQSLLLIFCFVMPFFPFCWIYLIYPQRQSKIR